MTAPTIVPLPVRMEVAGNPFVFSPHTRIVLDASAQCSATAIILAERLRTATGFEIPIAEEAVDQPSSGAILFTRTGCDPELGEEGYELSVAEDSIVIRAPHSAGLFYGSQTLRQLFPSEIESRMAQTGRQWIIPGVRIWDRPRFTYRGFMLDSSRHIQAEEFVRRTLDLMAYHKLNVFHWHLTDDNGWRIQTKKYPKLTEVGAWRHEDGKPPYGGYFNQQQLRSIIEYAAERHIRIIPEVDMPGHSLAAVASYPEIACTLDDYKVAGIGKGGAEMCPGKQQTLEFVRSVLDEVIALFPSEVIHIGGDECSRERWKKCKTCQAVIRREKLADEDALQNWFTRQISDYLNANGRRLQGWNEIMKGGNLPKSAIVHQWDDESAAVVAARAGHDVVVSRTAWTYFDYGYDITPLRKVYESDPVPSDFSREEERHILGQQAQLWTEFRSTDTSADQFIWPRLIALAEASWTPRNRLNWLDFLRRMKAAHYERLALRGLGAAGTGQSEVLKHLLEKTDHAIDVEDAGLR